MTQPASPSGSETKVGWLVLLGLHELAVPGWRQLRGAQYLSLAHTMPLIAGVNMFAALALATLVSGTAPAGPLVFWISALAVVLAVSFLGVHQAMPTLHHGPAPGALLRTVSRGLVLGLLWMMPPLLFRGGALSADELAIAFIIAAVMAAGTMMVAQIPLALIAFLLPAALGLSWMMRLTGSPLMIALPLAYGVALGVGGCVAGHAFIRRKRAELALEEKSEVVSLLLREYEESGADWLWQIDTAKRLVSVSGRLARAAGQAIEDLEGRSLLDLFAAADHGGAAEAPELRLLVDRLNAREPLRNIELPVTVAGDPHWWSLSAAPRFDDGGQFVGYRGVGSDITEQRRSSDRIEHMARFDTLTGLANRGQIIDAIRRALGGLGRDRSRCALLLIDLDKFKPVNDTLGHPVGDRLLKLVAERLRGLGLPGETFGRLGGDEFAVVLRDLTDPDRVDTLGKAIIDRLSQPFEVDGNLIRIGASVGAAVGPLDGRSTETLLRNADLALYRAKADGRGVHRRYEPAMLAVAARKRQIEGALREALEREQFHLLYQPVVDADSGRIESFEALLRWTHPTLGAMAPSEFMPIASEARIAGTICAWVLRTACTAAADWPDAVALSVNLSADQLADRQLPATILAALGQAGLQPGRLMLEVSERIFLNDNAALVGVLDRLQALGVRIALDDFGTGYASLGYVKHRRFSAIKIDDSFVRGASATTPESRAIVRAVIALADSLDVPTIAEGAETHEELARMYELGCRRVQGHLAAAPMSAEAARALVAARAIEDARAVA